MNIEVWENRRGSCPVKEFIVSQPPKAQTKIEWTIGLLENQGTDLLKTDHMKRLQGYNPSLYELRIYTMRKFCRILFVISDNTAWLLHGFIKQTDKTPKNHIDIALNRASNFISQ